jgi:hypothetical protein
LIEHASLISISLQQAELIGYDESNMTRIIGSSGSSLVHQQAIDAKDATTGCN